MVIFLIGSPGSGKTTLGTTLAHAYSLHHIQMGQIIRDHAREDNHKAHLMDHLANKKGKLLPDALTYEILVEQISIYGFKNLVIDGFPRTLNQLKLIEEIKETHGNPPMMFIYLKVSEQTAVSRILARRVCGVCHHTYKHTQEAQLVCDCSGEIDEREDNNPQAISSTLEEFYEHTQPVIDELRSQGLLQEIDAEKAIDDVFQTVSFPQEHAPESSYTNQQKGYQTLFVLTHSESDYNKRKIFTGQSDVPLTEVGHQKAKLIAEILRYEDIAVAYRTSLIRTKQTLDPFIEYHPDMEIIIEDRFLERDYGELVGKSKEDFKKQNPELWPLYHRSYDVIPPGGESIKQVEARVLPALQEVIERMKREKINILIVAHSNAIRPIRRYFEKLTAEEMMKLEHQRHQIFTYKIKVD